MLGIDKRRPAEVGLTILTALVRSRITRLSEEFAFKTTLSLRSFCVVSFLEPVSSLPLSAAPVFGEIKHSCNAVACLFLRARSAFTTFSRAGTITHYMI